MLSLAGGVSCIQPYKQTNKQTTCNDAPVALSFLQLAPSLPLQEDFVYHWKAITHYYIETSGKKHLKERVKLWVSVIRTLNY